MKQESLNIQNPCSIIWITNAYIISQQLQRQGKTRRYVPLTKHDCLKLRTVEGGGRICELIYKLLYEEKRQRINPIVVPTFEGNVKCVCEIPTEWTHL